MAGLCLAKFMASISQPGWEPRGTGAQALNMTPCRVSMRALDHPEAQDWPPGGLWLLQQQNDFLWEQSIYCHDLNLI